MERKSILTDEQRIMSPDGVAFLMENLWQCHKSGLKQRPCNVYMVELLPPTEEELRVARKSDVAEYGQEQLFGGFM